MVLVRINTTTGVAVVNLDDVSSILAIPEGSQINFKSQNPPLLNTSTPSEIYDQTGKAQTEKNSETSESA